MLQFEKPGSRDDFDYPQMAEESVKAALKDGGVSYQDIQLTLLHLQNLYLWALLHACIQLNSRENFTFNSD